MGERVIILPETWATAAVTFRRLVCRFSYALFLSPEKVEMGRLKLASKNGSLFDSLDGMAFSGKEFKEDSGLLGYGAVRVAMQVTAFRENPLLPPSTQYSLLRLSCSWRQPTALKPWAYIPVLPKKREILINTIVRTSNLVTKLFQWNREAVNTRKNFTRNEPIFCNWI